MTSTWTSDPTGGFMRLAPALRHHVVNTLGWRSLRPLQDLAVAPLVAGHDALLLAPTAGGKTEAAMFPLLTRMTEERWRGTSVLYVTPLRALLNNLEPRMASYAAWLGRSVAVRHGDTPVGQRRRHLVDRPDLLMTTPESLEAMLVSTSVDAQVAFADLHAVVVDEVHAFGGDDRGWHLVAVLERVSEIAGRPLQRVGLSATVGNAPDLLRWLQGGNVELGRTGEVVSAPPSGGQPPDLQIDYVGTLANAATVVAALHHGQKRLLFADSRRTVESLAHSLRGADVTTFVSHSSLSVDERRRAEAAFVEARDCVIVSTSTLELGIDVGDLDRVIQVGAPATVSSVLQRLGRTGRRAGAARTMLFLGHEDRAFLRQLGLLLLLSEGFVEPIVPPPCPRHVMAQQILALALQRRRVSAADIASQWQGIGWTAADLAPIVDGLVDVGYLDRDEGMWFVGPKAEHRYGTLHFRDLVAVFTAAPQFVVLHGRTEIGAVDPATFATRRVGPRVITLGGQSWRVTHVDWSRRCAYVEPSAEPGGARWSGSPLADSYALSNAVRRVLLGATPAGVRLSRRAGDAVARLRDEYAATVDAMRSCVTPDERRRWWWTWAGSRANAVLHAGLTIVAPDLLDESGSYDDWRVALSDEATPAAVSRALTMTKERFGPNLQGIEVAVDAKALKGLKFADLLAPAIARMTLAARNADPAGAALVAHRLVG